MSITRTHAALVSGVKPLCSFHQSNQSMITCDSLPTFKMSSSWRQTWQSHQLCYNKPSWMSSTLCEYVFTNCQADWKANYWRRGLQCAEEAGSNSDAVPVCFHFLIHLSHNSHAVNVGQNMNVFRTSDWCIVSQLIHHVWSLLSGLSGNTVWIDYL